MNELVNRVAFLLRRSATYWGLSDRDIASACGLDVHLVCGYMAGATPIPPMHLELVAQACGTSLQDVLTKAYAGVHLPCPTWTAELDDD